MLSFVSVTEIDTMALAEFGVAGPIKRSVTIAGHATSISLEPIFWDALAEAARGEAIPLNALVARIDVERIERGDPPNLASAIRTWLFLRLRDENANRSQNI